MNMCHTTLFHTSWVCYTLITLISDNRTAQQKHQIKGIQLVCMKHSKSLIFFLLGASVMKNIKHDGVLFLMFNDSPKC